MTKDIFSLLTVIVVTAGMLTGIAGCKKSSSSSDKQQVSSEKAQPAKRSVSDFPPCEKLVLKLRECLSKDSSLKVDDFRNWLLDDCKEMREKNPEKFSTFAGCMEMECSDMSSCLKNLSASGGK